MAVNDAERERIIRAVGDLMPDVGLPTIRAVIQAGLAQSNVLLALGGKQVFTDGDLVDLWSFPKPTVPPTPGEAARMTSAAHHPCLCCAPPKCESCGSTWPCHTAEKAQNFIRG